MAELEWFKSSYSDSSDINDCVEVATTAGAVLVRDSKDVQRDHLAFGPGAWAGFVAHASGS
ncbi:DUF397 domain-containing protein [Streptomyces sp. NBC_01006]|uniref:DUF397 domain-containing protein n=1 Tax=Streptomyces sp. NBC_01006 TaxID=2903716 RepID=UPI00386993CF|nr:DUF397 domain-containing protein [Streptomyces sp. NBC_01006]